MVAGSCGADQMTNGRLTLTMGLALISWAFCPVSDVLAAKSRQLAATPSECRVPNVVAWGGASVIKLRQVPAEQPEVRVVFLGSSSTAGAGASSLQRSFVAQFDYALGGRIPSGRVQVFNAGINGDTTADMLRRLRTDVLSRRPAVVIWQTGINDVLQGVPVDKFRRELTSGIAELESRAIQVVLIDQQDFIGAAKLPNFAVYVSAIESVARQTRVTLLQRYRVMRYLSQQRAGGLASLLNSDGLHMNDYTHKCIGELLAARIGRILG
jgi:acyl-CoA thioesterase-1